MFSTTSNRFIAFFTVYLVYICLAIPGIAAAEIRQCKFLFGSDFKSWTMKRTPTNLVASQFLPKDFLTQIEEDKGSVKTEVLNFTPARSALEKMQAWVTRENRLREGFLKYYKLPASTEGIFIVFSYTDKETHESNIFLRLLIDSDKNNPQKAILSGLNIINPLKEGEQAFIYASQNSKGLPFPIFNYLKRQIYDFLQQGGFTEVGADATQNYIVSLLYRKFLGLKVPVSSQNFYNYVDYLYDFVRKGPEILRPKNMNRFVEWLGSGLPGEKFYKFEKIWNAARLKDEFPDGYQPVYDQGNLVAIVNPNLDRKQVYFIDPNNPDQLFHWGRYKLATSLSAYLKDLN